MYLLISEHCSKNQHSTKNVRKRVQLRMRLLLPLTLKKGFIFSQYMYWIFCKIWWSLSSMLFSKIFSRSWSDLDLEIFSLWLCIIILQYVPEVAVKKSRRCRKRKDQAKQKHRIQSLTLHHYTASMVRIEFSKTCAIA